MTSQTRSFMVPKDIKKFNKWGKVRVSIKTCRTTPRNGDNGSLLKASFYRHYQWYDHSIKYVMKNIYRGIWVKPKIGVIL